jgi:hypothetical protein
VRLLADALALDPAQRAALAAAARPAVGAPPSLVPTVAAPAVPGLPVPPTPLVGRAVEVAAIAGVLREDGARLVTLTGPGGVGKTRLELRVAEDLATAFDGVAWVDLASLADPVQVPGSCARTLGLREEQGSSSVEVLRAFLCDKRLLLVLDNCEHVVVGVRSLLADLLATCPGLRVLATK